MKFNIKYFTFFISVFAIFLFAGCTLTTLEAPVLSRTGCLLSWSNINGAESYDLMIGDKTLAGITDTSLNIAPYCMDGIISVKIKANSISRFTEDSLYSEDFTIQVGSTKLATPSNFIYTVTNMHYIFSWDAVTYADGYFLQVTATGLEDLYLFTTETQLDVTNSLKYSGEFEVRLSAYSNDLVTYSPASYTEPLDFAYSVALATPTVNETTIGQNGNSYVMNWGAVDYASSYKISILGSNEIITSNTNSVDITNYVPDNGVVFACIQAVSNSILYSDSVFSNMCAYYTASGASSYGNINLNYLGTAFDLLATNAAELENIMYFAMYYRLVNLQFYYENNSLASSLLTTYRNNYMEENAGTSYSFSYQSFGIRGQKVLFTIQHAGSPTKYSTGDYVVSQSTKLTPQSYSTFGRDSDFNDFAVENRTQSITVYTSDQLYLALENGCKPIFGSVSCPANVVYIEAKSVLRTIIDDNMSEYEKTLAIYEWVCYNSLYDHNLLEMSENSGTLEMYKYFGFFAEGVFFNGGLAVCDGISKAFAILCNIEGIECYKVTGNAGSSGTPNSWSGHAWNKIGIDMDENIATPDKWYVVDATWGDMYVSDNVNSKMITEYLSHGEFLKTDDYNNQTHDEDFPNRNSAITEYDYFANTTYDGINDLVISNNNELDALAAYFNLHNLTGIEFKLAYTTSNVMRFFNNSSGISSDDVYIIFRKS